MPGKRRLQGLAVLHLVSGLLARFGAAMRVDGPFGLTELPLIPLFAFVFCQVSLLGLWAVFSRAAWWIRLGGLVLGAFFLERLVAPPSFGAAFFLVPTVATAVDGCALLVIRRLGLRMCVHTTVDPDSRSNREGFRFSIRGIMLSTIAIALLVAWAKRVHDGAGPFNQIFWMGWGLCFAAVGLTACWAALGLGPPRWRIMVTLALASLLGAIVAGAAGGPDDWEAFFYVITITLLQATILVASLFVLRSCGYRLVWRPKPPTFASITETPGNDEAACGQSSTGSAPTSHISPP